MLLRPVVSDPAVIVDAIARSSGQSVVLRGELDVDVYRLHRTDDETELVARVFGPMVDRVTVDAAARVLQGLADTRFPAERLLAVGPILSIGGGRLILVTEYVEPSPPPRPGFVMAWCAGLLGRLAARTGQDLPPGGGWHRLAATPSAEIDEALRLGAEVGSSVAQLVDTLADADDGAGLPEALVHPDLTPPNAIPQGDRPPVVIDWVGVGRGPRVWPLAFLLFTTGPHNARRNLDRYCRSVSLSDEELHRLPGIMIARPLTLDLWSVAHERMTAQEAITRFHAHHVRMHSVAAALNQ